MTDPVKLYAQLVDTFNQRDWQRAQNQATQLLSMVPHHPVVCYIAGVASMELQQMAPALKYLRQAIHLAPDSADFAVQLAKALSIIHMSSEARLAADRALALSPDNPISLDTLGVVYTQVQAHDQAVTVFSRAVTLMPAHAPYRFNLANAQTALGHLDAAEQALEACIALDSTHWRAHLALSQLRRQTPASNHISRLQSLVSQHRDNTTAQTYLHMSLAKEYEDLTHYPDAFAHLVRGKSAASSHRDYSIQRDEALFEALTDTFPITQNVADGCQTHEPIFIIGMPRSGTTLVERIISSHPDVHSAGELLNFGMVLKQASGTHTPNLIDSDTVIGSRNVDWKQLGEAYLASTRPITGHKLHFIDKLPHNFLYAGFIAHALPNAKIICLRRDPMDTCLSNFRQLFELKSAYFDYSFDLLDTGRYYILFDRLISHWQRVFPGRILEVDYETLVDTQEASSRRLLEYCNLPWHDACLRYEDNPSPVATASAVQVRAPIYRTALKRWKKYEAQLGELHQLLSQAGIKPCS